MNINKIILVKIVKILNIMDFKHKKHFLISNIDTNIIKNLKLTNIKKYWKYINQTQKKLKRYIKLRF